MNAAKAIILLILLAFIGSVHAGVETNALLNAQPILFVVRPPFPFNHHNTETFYQNGTIAEDYYRSSGVSALKSIDFGQGGKVTTIFQGVPGSVLRDPELSYDAKRIIFSMRKGPKDNFHIYEVNVDGTGLRQLTSSEDVSDIDPVYLPDGSIIFTSTREPKFCMCNRHIMGNLFRMEADGANIHQLGKSTLHEGHSSVMPDGRILYDRWEYVDRDFASAQALWTMNPDGTAHSIYWGNNTAAPDGVVDGRIIPGTQLCIATFICCHTTASGAIGILDRSRGVDGKDPVIQTWPAYARELVKEEAKIDSFSVIRPKYEDPFPLSRDNFLCSRSLSSQRLRYHKMGLALIDTSGGEVMLHFEEPSCYDPMPIKPRKKPPIRPVQRDYNNGPGTFYVQDIYQGTHMKGIERGTIKYLRVVESPPKLNWTDSGWSGQGAQAPGMNWHNFENKRILGTVKVEDDGSAYFECPSDTFVFFQALDANGMMVQSMRSGTIIQSGEKQGCVGCHEDRIHAPVTTSMPKALKRAPEKLNGWLGKPRLFSYQREVQPVFDKHCVKCHDYDQPAGKKLVLAKDRTISFNASYIDLWSLKYINCVGAGAAPIEQAKSWGSHASKLTRLLINRDENHKDVKLSQEELERIITWVDLNAPYYPTYDSAYSFNKFGRSPLTYSEQHAIQWDAQMRFVKGQSCRQRAQISFERPEKSRCLDTLHPDSVVYARVLALIRKGAARLKEKPRADMEGFQPTEQEQERLKQYQRRLDIEMEIRKAIREGRKIYDQ